MGDNKRKLVVTADTLEEYAGKFSQWGSYYGSHWLLSHELTLCNVLLGLRAEGLLPVPHHGDDSGVVKRLRTALNEQLNMNESYYFNARKLHILKHRYKKFTEVLCRSGFDWDPHSNLTRTSPAFWLSMIEEGHKDFLPYYKHGEQHYMLMQQIFTEENGFQLPR